MTGKSSELREQYQNHPIVKPYFSKSGVSSIRISPNLDEILVYDNSNIFFVDLKSGRRKEVSENMFDDDGVWKDPSWVRIYFGENDKACTEDADPIFR